MRELFRGDGERHHTRDIKPLIQPVETGAVSSSEVLHSTRHVVNAAPQQGHWYRERLARVSVWRVHRSGQEDVRRTANDPKLSDRGVRRGSCEGGAQKEATDVRQRHDRATIGRDGSKPE